MLSESATQLEFYILLRRHASECMKNYALNIRRNYRFGMGWLIRAQEYHARADRILNMTRADFKRWQWFHTWQYTYQYFKLVDLYGKPEIKSLWKGMPHVNRPANRTPYTTQLSLF